MPRALRSDRGFTYIGALVMAVILGIMASRAAVVMSTAMKREREDELISRGTQIRDALRKWYKVKVVDGKLVSSQTPSNAAPTAPAAVAGPPELKSLLQDPNTPGKLRYLRPYALVDPMTGKEWDEIKKDGKIVGVKSKSEQAPVKQGNFPFDLHPEDFEHKKKYSEWEFVYDRVPPLTKTGGAIQGLKTESSPSPFTPGASDSSGTSGTSGTSGSSGSSDDSSSTRRSRFNRGNTTP
ncbi:type II secretion system protein [Geomonas anaerohicana]|uniref:type II secretion system protein n=1 Tax=Geomonas anaerohicana TaxID=2798583 RepID=UPI001F167A36|nr:type II secretion system protein [Geomonas anaerohicana]